MQNIIPPDAPLKQCNTCLQFFPATTNHFYKKLNGLVAKCKPCSRTFRKEHQHSRRKPRPDIKPCTKCNTPLPYTDEFFYHSKYYKKYGLMAHCKKCHSAWRIEHRQANKEIYHERDRAYYQRGVRQAYARNHREQMRQYGRKSYHVHSEKYRDYRRQYYRLNAHEVSLYSKRYKETHREKIREYQRHYDHREYVIKYRKEWCHNRRARKRTIPGKHTLRQIQEKLQRQHYRCYYCQKHFQRRNGRYIYQIEHTFPLSRANGIDPINDISYLVLACPLCNNKKHNLYPWEWSEGGRLL